MTAEIKKFERTTEGLRDALMSEMEDIKAGVATFQEAQAFANLAAQVIESLRADLAAKEFEDRRDQREHQKQMFLIEQKKEEKEIETIPDSRLYPGLQ